MEVEPFTKGSTVEVSSDDAGFHGAWYVATLVDIVDSTPTKTRASNKKNRLRKRIGFLVKYATLFQETNFAEPLTEVVDPLYVRPLPPRNPRRENDNQEAEAEAETEVGGGDFQVSDVVDAYLRDGWWIGVVSKVIGDGEIKNKKYVISFESPPEEVEFDGSQIRLHVDWVDSGWKLRPQKKQNQESSDKNVTQTSESNNGAHSSLITPPKGALSNDSAFLRVGKRLLAKKKRNSRKKAVTNVETVGVVVGSVTYRRAKRIVNLGEEGEEDLNGNLQSSSNVEKSGSKGNTEDSPNVEQEMIDKETSDNSQLKRKRGRPQKLPSQSPNGSLEENQESTKKDSSGIHQISTELDEQPLSVWYQGLNPLPIFKKSSCNTDEPIDTSNPTMVNEGQTTETHNIWPFIKRSPIWATIESHELFQNLSQNPHFSPLWEMKEDYREGFAIAHMVTFANVVQRTTNLQWTDPNHVIKNSLETLVDLEANGFDVGPIRARLDELLAKKSEAGRLEGEMKEAEKEVEKCNMEKSAIDEEIIVLERKMREIEEKMVKAVAMKNVKDEEVMVVRSKLQVFMKRIDDWKLGFEELVGSPL
ncbi:hypothetical protein L2E82_31019 [Cichorium intybus]|uniref:Uncharacterized protein n=1 Tax=Cichorium intybus TaxID=13427 RepID=A0ACB9D219_CICIN|nr:hypothetical protein L2E82_31019 [Cichorium intybus]